MGRLRTNPEAINLIKLSPYYLSEASNKYFDNKNPLYVEIGMGKGLFIINNAIKYQNINYIGIEKYPTVILKAIKKTEVYENNFHNLKIICDDANNLKNWFKNKSVDKIFLNFSDPWPKKRHESKRLTSIGFMNIYKQILKPKQTIEFKTDNQGLYEYTLDQWMHSKDFKVEAYTDDLYSNADLLKDNIPTEYENKFIKQGIKIKKIIVSLI